METKEIFEHMAHQYDTEERIKDSKIIANAVRAELKDTHQKKALDYGCGTGLIGLELIDMFESMLFVDTSSNMIEQVQTKIEKAHISTASALCCDFFENIPADLHVDYIVTSRVLLHVKDYESLLKGLYNVLNKDGHLIVIDFDKNENIVSDKVHNGFEQSELIRLAKQIGFCSASAHTFYHGEKIFMNLDASMFILDAIK